MAVNFNRGNPAIARFQAGVAYGDQQRRLEAQDFEQRRQREQTQGVDRALREGVGAMYAAPPQPQAPTEPVGPTVQPPVQITPAIVPNGPAPVAPQNAAGDPNELPGGNVPSVAPAPAAPTASPSSAAAPAISKFGAGDQTRALMNRLSQTPGAGTVMMQEHGHEQTRQAQARSADRMAATQDRQARNEGWNQFNKHLDDFNVDAARRINQQYALGIPDEAWTNIKFRNSMLLGAKLSKDMFGVRDEHRPKFLHEFMKNIGADKSEHESAIAAYAAVSAPDPNEKPGMTGTKRLVKNAQGQYVWVYEGGGSKSTDVQGSVPGARGGGGGAGGKPSSFRQKYDAWIEVHPGDKEGALKYAHGTRMNSDVDISKAAVSAAQRDRSSSPKPWSQDQFDARVEQYRRTLRGGGGGAAPPPAAAPATAGPATSGAATPTAAAAKPRLMFDREGNQVR